MLFQIPYAGAKRARLGRGARSKGHLCLEHFLEKREWVRGQNIVDRPLRLANPKTGRIDDAAGGRAVFRPPSRPNAARSRASEFGRRLTRQFIEQDLHQEMAFEDDQCPVRSWQVPSNAILEIFRSNGNDVVHTTFYLISDLYRTLSYEKLWYFARSLSSGRRDERS
jgi:hypothetical protein